MNEEIVLDLRVDAEKVRAGLQDVTSAINALKEEQKQLKKEIEAGGESADALTEVYAKNDREIKTLTATQKAYIGQLQATQKEDAKLGDSFREIDAYARQLENQYKALSKAQRESAAGQELKKELIETKERLKEFDEELGNHQRNVGNYPKAIQGPVGMLFKLQDAGKNAGKMTGALTKAIKGGATAFVALGTAAKTATLAILRFLATPIGAIIAAVVAVLAALVKIMKGVAEQTKKNDQASTSWAKLMAVFKPLIEGITAAFDKLATAFGKVAEKIAGWIGGMSESVKAAQDFVQAQDDLEEAEREYVVNSAQRNKEIAALRAAAANKEKFTVEERIKMMDIAIKKERENLGDERKIKNEQLRLLIEQAEREKDTSDEMKDKIAAARAAALQADTAYYDGVRRLQKQRQSFVKEQEDEEKKAAEEARKRIEEKRKREEEAEKARQANLRQIQQQAEDFALSLIEDETARSIAARKLQGEREIKALQEKLNTEKNLTEESRAMLAALIKGKQEQLDAELDQMAKDAADKRTEEELQREQEKAQRILDYRLQLAEKGSEEELELQKQALEMQMQQALDNTELEEEEKYLIRQTFAKKAEELDKQYHDNLVKQAKDAKAQYAESLKAAAGAASDAFGAMSDLLGEYSEQSEEAAAAQKAFGIAKIIVDQATSIADTAKAITAAVAGATEAAASTGPAAPFLLAGYIASMVGAVLGAVASVAGSIMQAKQVIQGADNGGDKFATGGIVGGNSYTGDKVPIMANSREMVLNMDSQKRLFDALGGSQSEGTLGFNYELFARAVAAQPAPVLAYDEFSNFQKKVATYKEIAKV